MTPTAVSLTTSILVLARVPMLALGFAPALAARSFEPSL